MSGFEQEHEDAHITLTPVLETQKTGGPTQSSSVTFDFTSKLLNLDNPSPADNEIASLMDTTAYHAYDDEFNLKEDENIDEEEDDEVTKELYKDVNINLGNKDADMTYAEQGAT
nr:hypothetical protein [Tanacetum cinerariifolium]